jgi:hypothetical protein
VSQQFAQNRHHPLGVLEFLRAANAPRDELEIAPPDLERESSPSQVEFDQSMFHLPGEMLQDLYYAFAVHEVALEGGLFPDRLAFPRGFDWPVVFAAHKVIELAPLFPKEGTQALLAQALEIGPICYAQLPEFCCCDLAYAKESVDRQRVKKGRSLFWGDYCEAIRFVSIRGEFPRNLLNETPAEPVS